MKKTNKFSVILELLLTFIAGFIFYRYLGSAFPISIPEVNGDIIKTLNPYIPFYVGASYISGWYVISSTIKLKRRKKYNGLADISRPLLKIIFSGMIGIYVLPFRTLRNLFKLIY